MAGKAEMKRKSFVIFGISKFGRSMAEELSAAGIHVLAVDRDSDRVAAVADLVTMAVVGDVTDPQEMGALGLSNFDGAIVATTGNLSAGVMGVLLAKEAGIPYVLAKASDEMQAKVFQRLGADRVIIPEKESAARVAQTLIMGNFIDLVELSDRIRLVEIPIPQEWEGRTLKELDLRGKHHLNVVALREQGQLTIHVDPGRPLPAQGSLLVVADKTEFDRMGL